MAVPTVVRRPLRLTLVCAPLVLVATLAACGGDDDADGPRVLIQPSTFTTQLTQTTAANAGADAGDSGSGGTVAGTQVYEVQSGDFLAGIASDFDIPLESIANFNDWPEGTGHVIHPGDTVRIPPGAKIPDPDDGDDDDEDEDDEDDEDDEEDEEDEDDDGERRCPDGTLQGTYTVEEGDFPAQVARDLDVTVVQLNEANRNTRGYSGFIVGIEILVPCGDDD